LIVTIDTEQPCLLIYPLPEWELIEAKIEALPSFNPTTRRIQRLLIGHATEVEVDGNGRLLLSNPLREYAQLGKKVVLIGQGKKFELWDEALWNQRMEFWLSEPEGGETPAALAELTL
jgi:MraZ protein